jgi:hypothetical protein
MKNTYLKIELEETSQPEKSNFLGTLLKKLFSTIIPKANPDFEGQIHNINIWLIEFDEDGIPEREIGLDKYAKTVMIMPWKDNYGYWTDNNFKLQDLKNGFKYSEIEKDYFEKEWIEFDQNNP